MAEPEEVPEETRADEHEDEAADDDASGRLPSFDGVNLSIGEFMAGLEQKILHNRPPAVVVVEEHRRGETVATNGLVIDDLPTEPLDRPEPPDTSGAKL
ncbi:MAG TPA: hypothetical protein VGO32_06480 [Candidatus Limnocylindria bacterium]|nr:hypothetical protein [Candidatus Limnocylindria bacterium]